MRTGEVESNLRRLNEDFRIPQIDDLIARKLAGDERMQLSPAELEAHRPQFDRLCVELDEARDRSSLPEEPGGRDELNDFLVRLRTRELRR
jgi:predicted nucleotidyltransferase